MCKTVNDLRKHFESKYQSSNNPIDRNYVMQDISKLLSMVERGINSINFCQSRDPDFCVGKKCKPCLTAYVMKGEQK